MPAEWWDRLGVHGSRDEGAGDAGGYLGQLARGAGGATEGCVFEHIAPAAASFGRHEGQAAVRAVWVSLAEHFPQYRFEIEDVFAAGDRCACRWSMTWRLPDGGTGSGRGVDIFRVRDGKVAEKLTYVTL